MSINQTVKFLVSHLLWLLMYINKHKLKKTQFGHFFNGCFLAVIGKKQRFSVCVRWCISITKAAITLKISVFHLLRFVIAFLDCLY